MSSLEGQSLCLRRLEADLAARVNPERSRLFDARRLLLSRDRLLALTSCWTQPGPARFAIVGSNGKGSTAFTMAALADGPTGLFTSPHLTSVLERIRIRGQPVHACEALDVLNKIESICEHADLSYFEMITLMAVRLFEERGCGIQIFEAGLGGRFDAVHIARAETVILTSISLEHTSVLGKTREAILREKLGIITSATKRLITMPQVNLSQSLIEKEARAINPDLEIHPFARPMASGESYLKYNREFAECCLRSAGQPVLELPEVQPPGRLEKVELVGSDGKLSLMYDSGHNPDAIHTVLSHTALDPLFVPGSTVVFLGVLKDRDPGMCISRAVMIGYERLYVIAAPFLAAADDAVNSITPAELSGAALAEASKGRRSFIVIGSHYIYNFFLEMVANLEKTGYRAV